MVYVRVDDGYQEHGMSLLRGQVGANPGSVAGKSSPSCGGGITGPLRARARAIAVHVAGVSAEKRGGVRGRVRRGDTLASPCLLDTPPVPVVVEWLLSKQPITRRDSASGLPDPDSTIFERVPA